MDPDAQSAALHQFAHISASRSKMWRTVSCVTAPKLLPIQINPPMERPPPDTSHFVFIKYQALSVPPREQPPIEAAARTLHAMGSVVEPISTTPSQTVPAPPYGRTLPSLSAAANHMRPAPIIQKKHIRRTINHRHSDSGSPSSPENHGSSSNGSGTRDIFQCHFQGCGKVCIYAYNLTAHWFFLRHKPTSPD